MAKHRTLGTLARSLEFKTERQAADYIMLSRINGNHHQARGYFQALSPAHKARCIEYLREVHTDEEVADGVTDWLSGRAE